MDEHLIGVRLRETAPADDYKIVDLFARLGDLVLVETAAEPRSARCGARGGPCRSTGATSSTAAWCASPRTTKSASTASAASARRAGSSPPRVTRGAATSP